VEHAGSDEQGATAWPILWVMGRMGDARTWVLLTSGYGLAVSVGLFCVAIRLDERVIAGWGAACGAFYLAVIAASPLMLTAAGRRWWFAIAALVNVGLCAFAELAGFIVFGAPLVTYMVLFIAPYGFGRDRARFAGADGGGGGAGRSAHGPAGTSTR
jgi:hypothetical protein